MFLPPASLNYGEVSAFSLLLLLLAQLQKELRRESHIWGLSWQCAGKGEASHPATVFIPLHYDMLSLKTHTRAQAHTERDIREACQGRPILPGPDSKQLEQKAAVGKGRQEQATQDRGQVDTEFLA